MTPQHFVYCDRALFRDPDVWRREITEPTLEAVAYVAPLTYMLQIKTQEQVGYEVRRGIESPLFELVNVGPCYLVNMQQVTVGELVKAGVLRRGSGWYDDDEVVAVSPNGKVQKLIAPFEWVTLPELDKGWESYHYQAEAWKATHVR